MCQSHAQQIFCIQMDWIYFCLFRKFNSIWQTEHSDLFNTRMDGAELGSGNQGFVLIWFLGNSHNKCLTLSSVYRRSWILGLVIKNMCFSVKFILKCSYLRRYLNINMVLETSFPCCHIFSSLPQPKWIKSDQCFMLTFRRL